MTQLNYDDGVAVVSSKGKTLPAKLSWRAEEFIGKTSNSKEFILYKCFVDTATIEFTPERIGALTKFDSYEYKAFAGNDLTIDFDMSCNCHGFSLMKKEFWLNDPIPILECGYDPIDEKDLEQNVDYLVTFLTGGLCMHSGKYNNGLVTQKTNVGNEETVPICDVELKYGKKVLWKAK